MSSLLRNLMIANFPNPGFVRKDISAVEMLRRLWPPGRRFLEDCKKEVGVIPATAKWVKKIRGKDLSSAYLYGEHNMLYDTGGKYSSECGFISYTAPTPTERHIGSQMQTSCSGPTKKSATARNSSSFPTPTQTSTLPTAGSFVDATALFEADMIVSPQAGIDNR